MSGPSQVTTIPHLFLFFSIHHHLTLSFFLLYSATNELKMRSEMLCFWCAKPSGSHHEIGFNDQLCHFTQSNLRAQGHEADSWLVFVCDSSGTLYVCVTFPYESFNITHSYCHPHRTSWSAMSTPRAATTSAKTCCKAQSCAGTVALSHTTTQVVQPAANSGSSSFVSVRFLQAKPPCTAK